MSSSSKLFMGNLASRAKERDVEDFFRGYGKIREIVLKDGYGFIEFEDGRTAMDALDGLNGRDLCGERIRLELSKQGRRSGGYHDRYHRSSYRDDSRGRSFNLKRDKYGVPYKTRYRMLVDNLSTRCSWQDLKDMMRNAGEVTYAEAHKFERNHALVCFASRKDLQRAIEKYQGKDINGRKIKLTDDSSSSTSDGGGRRTSRSRSPMRSPRRRTKSRSRSRSPPGRKSQSPAASRSRTRSRSPPAGPSRTASPSDN